MKLKTIEVKGRQFDVSVTEDGRFWTVFDGEGVYAASLAGLESALASRITRAKVKLSIPFVRWDHKLIRGVITGIHASNNNILVQLDGGRTEQEYGWNYSSSEYLKPEAAGELEKLGKARDEAGEAYDRFIKAHSFSPKDAVRAAMPKDVPEAV